MNFTQQFLAEVQQVVAQLDVNAIEQAADELARVRERGGRLFILGVGGSAGNAGHAVMISARSAVLRPMRPPTTSPN